MEFWGYPGLQTIYTYQNIGDNQTLYFYITADISKFAQIGDNIQVDAIKPTDLTINEPYSFTGLAIGGSLQTIVEPSVTISNGTASIINKCRSGYIL